MSDSLKPELTALSVVFLVLAVFVVALRSWAGYVSTSHKLGFDDWFAAATIPFILIQTALVLHSITLGLGLPSATLPYENVEAIKRYLFISSYFFNTAIVLPKISALAFYNRIFGQTVRWFQWSLYSLAIINAAWLLTAYVLVSLQCRPASDIWTLSLDGQPNCLPQWTWLVGLAAPSSFIDIIIFILPMPLLWRIQASRQRKWVMTGVFAIGYCVLVVSLGRLLTLAIYRESLASDPTYSSIRYLEWVQCEASVSAISVSLPNIFTLVRRMQEHGTAFVITGRRSATNPPPLPPKHPGKYLTASALHSPNILFSPTAEKPRGDAWLETASLSTNSSRRKSERQRQERRGRVGNSRLDSYPTRLSVPTRTIEFSDAKTVAFSVPGRPVALQLQPKALSRKERRKSIPRLPLLAANYSPAASSDSPDAVQYESRFATVRDTSSSMPRTPHSAPLQRQMPQQPLHAKSLSMNHIVSQARRTIQALSPRASQAPTGMQALPSTPDLLPRQTPTLVQEPTVSTIHELPEHGRFSSHPILVQSPSTNTSSSGSPASSDENVMKTEPRKSSPERPLPLRQSEEERKQAQRTQDGERLRERRATHLALPASTFFPHSLPASSQSQEPPPMPGHESSRIQSHGKSPNVASSIPPTPSTAISPTTPHPLDANQAQYAFYAHPQAHLREDRSPVSPLPTSPMAHSSTPISPIQPSIAASIADVSAASTAQISPALSRFGSTAAARTRIVNVGEGDHVAFEVPRDGRL